LRARSNMCATSAHVLGGGQVQRTPIAASLCMVGDEWHGVAADEPVSRAEMLGGRRRFSTSWSNLQRELGAGLSHHLARSAVVRHHSADDEIDHCISGDRCGAWGERELHLFWRGRLILYAGPCLTRPPGPFGRKRTGIVTEWRRLLAARSRGGGRKGLAVLRRPRCSPDVTDLCRRKASALAARLDGRLVAATTPILRFLEIKQGGLAHRSVYQSDGARQSLFGMVRGAWGGLS